LGSSGCRGIADRLLRSRVRIVGRKSEAHSATFSPDGAIGGIRASRCSAILDAVPSQ
jgi:hypothetical protein